MHPFDTMTEPELGLLMTRVAHSVKKHLPPDTGFIVLVTPRGPGQAAQYVANSNRDDCIMWMRETVERMERRDDVERNPP